MSADKKVVIGVTGSFGTGKTFVASIFRSLGAEVLDADRIAHQVLRENRSKVSKAFGCADRKALAAIVFSDKKALAKLNRLIHPGVIDIIKRRIRRSARKAVVIDAPLLVEARLTSLTDCLVVVKASRRNQTKRCVKKFGMDRCDVENRILSQVPLEKKAELADFVVDNDGTRSETRKQVRKIWGRIWR